MAAEIPEGAVVVARAILNSSLWTMRVQDRVVAMTCIALCNFKDRDWFDGQEWVTIKRGQFVRSRKNLATACNVSVQTLRTSLKRLEKERSGGEIPFLTRKVTRRYTLYTLPKYEFYQDLKHYSDSANPKANPKTNPKGDLTQLNPKTNPIKTPNQPDPEKPVKAIGSASTVGSRRLKKTIQPADSKKLTTKTRKSNHQQEQQQQECINKNKTASKSALKLMSSTNRQATILLDRICPRRGVLLLLLVGVKESVAKALSYDRPIGEIVDLTQAARGKSNPGGWVVQAIKGKWTVPKHEAGRVKILAALEADNRKAEKLSSGSGLSTKNPEFKRRSGESEDAWFARVNGAVKAKKKASRK